MADPIRPNATATRYVENYFRHVWLLIAGHIAAGFGLGLQLIGSLDYPAIPTEGRIAGGFAGIVLWLVWPQALACWMAVRHLAGRWPPVIAYLIVQVPVSIATGLGVAPAVGDQEPIFAVFVLACRLAIGLGGGFFLRCF